MFETGEPTNPLRTIFAAPPTAQTIARFRTTQEQAGFSYPEVGATLSANFPSSYTEDHRRTFLGTGDDIFRAACDALDNWRMSDLPWLQIHAGGVVHMGQTVIIVARVGFVWCLNAARVVYRVDESYDAMRRYGFAYGTLPAHVERGEEIFQITQNRADGAGVLRSARVLAPRASFGKDRLSGHAPVSKEVRHGFRRGDAPRGFR